MKKIEAVVRSEKLEAIKSSLNQYGIQGMTVSEVAGCGLQKGKTGTYRGNEYELNLLPKIKIEIVTSDDRVEQIVGIIQEAAKTGRIGDGKIFISEISDVIRIRTGEYGEAAIG